MPNEDRISANHCISFGSFDFYPARQLLLDAGKPVRIGGRACDILMALVEKQGQIVSKQELLERVWPNIFVEEGNLRVHVAALRRALGDGQGGKRYINNIAGRGYSFVPPVNRATPGREDFAPAELPDRPADIPLPLVRMVGRADTVADLAERLRRHRFITIVGPGGIGKTTVAVAIADSILSSVKDGVCFVDFAPLTGPLLAASALAARLGVAVRSDNPLPTLIQFLKEKNILIVLDSCENVIEAAAVLAEEIFNGTKGTLVLATSRESLRAEGEHVYRLPPLGVPDETAELTAAEALAFPSVQLFIERAAASSGDFELSDRDAPLVAAICRRLDGIALAIEIAAGRVDAFGVTGLAALLNDRFQLLMQGRRTALPRHRTLSATLDWSYSHLPEAERIVLRRLAVFAGSFTMESASAVLAGTGISSDHAVDAIANLVMKSLVSADTHKSIAFYRLLDTTRDYSLFKLEESGERDRVAQVHAEHYKTLLERAQASWETRPAAEWLDHHRHLIDNARTALDWAFSASGDATTGVAITIGAIPLWFQLSLISECAERIDRALATADANRDSDCNMRLHATRAWALMQTKGSVPETEVAWTQVLEISEQQGDVDHQLRALWGLWSGFLNRCELRTALTVAQKFSDLAGRRADAQDRLVGDRMIGYLLHLMGDQQEARRYIERMLDQYQSPVIGAQIIRFVFDQRATAQCFLARILWLQGFADQAVRLVETIVQAAIAGKNVLSLCQILVQAACPLALHVGDLAALERYVTMLLDLSARQALDFWRVYGRCFHALLVIRRGQIDDGIPMLGVALEELREIQYGVYYTMFLGEYADALRQGGRWEEGLTVIEEVLARCERNDERWYFAELLRIRGEILLRRARPDAVQKAEQCFMEALDWSQRQGISAWQLRAATSLAKLYRTGLRDAEAQGILSRACENFTEGFDTADLREAKAFLAAASG
jgi:predicted ATPase/DNA-binding winged helix-turn-helix (wHTH) protein